MTEEEIDDDINKELKISSIVYKDEELVNEETLDKIEDKTILIDEHVEKLDNDKQEVKDNGEKSERIDKIERSSKDSRHVSLEDESTTSSKLTDDDKDELEKEKEEKEDEEEEDEKVKKEEEEKEEEKEEDEDKKVDEDDKKKKIFMQQVKKGTRQCGRQFREIIGKQELKKEELEKREVNLRQRLDVLECSMPAVMVWNVWQRMAQGVPIPNFQQLMEKQFRTPAAGEACCPNTPSQHYDCRIREVEAERKTAHKRLEDARILWLEKEVKLKEGRDKLEEAKKIQEERKERIERLTMEAKELRETLKRMDERDDEEMLGFCESGECGDVQCRERWLRGVSSVDSIKAIDVECLSRLRQLAETELTMKKQIAELERREETYMRTLQHADEMWSKMEGDTADTLSTLQEQLDKKANANQQLASRICELEDEIEKLRVKMAVCKSELTKYMSVRKIETIIGGEDDFAKTTDKMVGIKPKVAAKVIGREDDLAEVLDKEILIKDVQEDKETLAKVDVTDKEVSPDIVRPVEPMEQDKMDAMHKYLAMLGSLEELYYDDDYGICGTEFTCYEDDWQEIQTDVELSTTYTGSVPVISDKIISKDDIKKELDEEEIEDDDILPQLMDGRIVKSELKHVPDDLKEIDETFKEEEEEEEKKDDYYFEEEETYEEMYEPEVEILDEIEKPVIDQDNAIIPLNKLRSWVNTVDTIRLVISKCSTCSNVKINADHLAEEIATYAGVQAKEVITEIIPKLTEIVEHVDDEELQEDAVGVQETRRVTKEKEIISEPLDEIQVKIEMKGETDVIEDIKKIEIEDIKEEIPMIDIAEVKTEKPVTAEVFSEDVKKTIEVKPIEKEYTLLDSDKLDIVTEKLKEEEEKEILEEKILKVPEEKIIEETIDIPVKEPLIEYDKPVFTKELEKIEKDIVVREEIKEKEQLDDDRKIILSIQKLPEEEEEEEEEEKEKIIISEIEEIKLKDDPDKDVIDESIELKEKIDKIKVEEVVTIKTEKTEMEDEILRKSKDDDKTKVGMIRKDELVREVKSKIEIKEETVDKEEEASVKLEADEEVSDVEEIFVDAETKELPVLTLPTSLAKDIPETIVFKKEEKEEEIPILEDVERIEIPEKVLAEEKLEKMEMKVLEEKPIKIEVKKMKKEEMVLEEGMPILRKVPEIKEEIEEIPDKLSVIEPLPISVEEDKIKEKPKTPIDPRIVATPYLAVADIEGIEKELSSDILIADDLLPCECKRSEEIKEPPPPVLPVMQIVITQTEIVQTVINRSTQTSTVYPIKLKITDQKSKEISAEPEISEGKMRWRKRPKNRSGVSNFNVSSQTDKPLLVLRSTTQEPNLSEKQRILSDILRSLKSNLNAEENEIRSINYGKKINETYKCDCCVCGNNSNSVPTKISTTVGSSSLLKLLNKKVSKMDKNTQEERSSYRTLKSNNTEKLLTSTLRAPYVSKFNKQVCDEEICTCSASNSKIKVDTSWKQKYKLEKKDQSCLAKISKRKIRSREERKKDEKEIEAIKCQGKCGECLIEEKIKERMKSYKEDDLDSPSNCICTKIERTDSGRLWKREICGCDDYDLSPITTNEK